EEFGEDAWSQEEKKLLMQQLRDLWRTTADPGLHAAAEWLLRQLHDDTWLNQIDEAWEKDGEQRKKRLQEIKRKLARETATPQWYVTGQGQTMVVIPGPVEFLMGSPPSEPAWKGVEDQHRKRISRNFAIAAKSVTVKQFRRFLPQFSHSEMRRYPEPTCPIG